MIDAYLRDLAAELRRVGIHGARRRRILLETEDHLRSGPGSLERFGDATEIARRFAEELAGTSARRVSLGAFTVLVGVGVLFGALMLAFFSTTPARALACCTPTAPAQLGTVAVVVVAPQVSFVAGVLAALRAVRLRHQAPTPGAEVRILRRRTAVALLAGAATMAALVLFTVEYGAVLPAWAMTVSVASAALSLALLAATSVPLLVASRIRVQTAGRAGDLFADLGPAVPAPLRARPWAFASLVALILLLVVFVAGAVAGDGYDAALRGAAEAAACLAGFAVLGRFLALRH